MDREQEAGIIGASGAGLLVVGLIAYIAWRKRNKQSEPGGGEQPSGEMNEASLLPYLNNNYELSDDGYYITSYTNGSTVGWRNHNPTNIVQSPETWRGKVANPDPKDNKERFISNIYGYRAALLNLRTYIRKGYNTLEKIVDRWSGKSNNTAYRDFVYANSILERNTPIAEDDWTSLMSLVNAMAMMENGKSPEPDENEIVDAALMVYNGV